MITLHTIVKNEGKFVKAALLSALSSNEVERALVWDTGSKDKTVEEILSIKDRRIEFRQRGNVDRKTLVLLRKEQLAATRTPWFMLVDGDEIWPEKNLQKLISAMKKSGPEIIALVNKTRNAVGDLHHYLPESEGHYQIGPWSGHLNIRAIRNLAKLTVKGEYPNEWFEVGGKKIQDHPACPEDYEKVRPWRPPAGEASMPRSDLKRCLKFVDTWYLHTTHLKRSENWLSEMLTIDRLKKHKWFYRLRGKKLLNMKYIVAAVGLVAIHIAILTQLRFEVWPEMMVMPYLQQNGFELYRDMIVPWTPGLMWILHGWFNLVGLSVDRLKFLTWGLIAGIDFLIFFIAGKRWGEKAGLAALAFFVLFQPVFDGNGLWFDLAVIPFLLAAFYWRQPLLLGPAFLIKQSIIWLLPIFLFNRKKYQILYRVKYLILTALSFFGISSLWFLSRGTLSDYWFWAYDFAFRKLPAMPGHRDLGNWRMWMVALVPFALLGGITRQKLKHLGGQGGIRRIGEDPFWWAVLSIPFALPRFGLFHFQPALAFLSLAAGMLFRTNKTDKTNRENKINMMVILLLIVFLAVGWSRIIRSGWQKADRFLEPEVYQLAAKVALGIKKEEPMLLINAPELVYVLADRLPPKPWLTQFPWFLELPGFQEELVEKFKAQNLHQVVIEPYKNEGEFTPGSYQPKILLEYVSKVK